MISFALPGQLNGPECGQVMKEAIAIRKELEPRIGSLVHAEIENLTIILRVSGTLGGFGSPEGVESISRKGSEIECELIVKDHGWKSRDATEIRAILRPLVIEAVKASFEKYGVSHSIS